MRIPQKFQISVFTVAYPKQQFQNLRGLHIPDSVRIRESAPAAVGTPGKPPGLFPFKGKIDAELKNLIPGPDRAA